MKRRRRIRRVVTTKDPLDRISGREPLARPMNLLGLSRPRRSGR